MAACTQACRGLFEVGADQPEQLLHALAALRIGGGGLAEIFADVGFQYFGHQAVYRTTQCRDLLQHRAAISAGFEGALECIALAADAADASEGALFFGGGVGHGAAAWILGGSIRRSTERR